MACILRINIVTTCVAAMVVFLFFAQNSLPQGIPLSLPDPGDTAEIKPRFAQASSFLLPQLGKRDKDYFAPRKAIDGNWETCWAEAAAGNGAGEWIKLIWLTQEIPTHIGVLPGWAKSKTRWKNNPRLKTAEVVLSNGFMQTVEFEDRMQVQFVELRNTRPAEWLQLIIGEVYPGERFQDTSISEIKIFKRESL